TAASGRPFSSRAAAPGSRTSWACRCWARCPCRHSWRIWPTPGGRSSPPSPIRRRRGRSTRSRAVSPTPSPPSRADVRLLLAALSLLQSPHRVDRPELHGHSWGAAKDAKAMRDAYAHVLAADSSCADCYLGLGVYQYGLGRAGALARFVAKLVGLGSGNAEQGIRYMRRAAVDGDLAR